MDGWTLTDVRSWLFDQVLEKKVAALVQNNTKTKEDLSKDCMTLLSFSFLIIGPKKLESYN